MSDVRYGALLGNGSTSSQQDLDWRSRMHLVQILEHSFKHVFTPGCSTKSTIDISTLATKLLVDFFSVGVMYPMSSRLVNTDQRMTNSDSL